MFRKIGDAFRNFMIGRYGQDQLGSALCTAGLITMVLSMLFGRFWLSSLFSLLSWVLLFWCMFRIFSRNLEARAAENAKFLSYISHAKDKEHRYFRCPHCRQTVRVPRGRGKINITCPKCGSKFIKKS